MQTDVWRALIAAFLPLTLVGLAGCKSQKPGQSTLGAKVGSRQIQAVLEGSAFIAPRADSAVIAFARGKLTIEKTRVLLNDTELATIPEAATNVNVDYSGGKLTVTADGTEVYSAALRQ